MNDLYHYKCYKYHLVSNVPLNYLPATDRNDVNNERVDLTCIHAAQHNNERIYVSNNSEYTIESPFASYVINTDNNRITAYCGNQIEMEATLYNLPMSLIAQNHNDILLHASGIKYKDTVIAFCADKGTGKTTLVSHLSKKMNYFSDDTVYVTLNNNVASCFSSGLPLKMNQDTFMSISSDINTFKESSQSLQNKKYIDIKRLGLMSADFDEHSILKNLFFLRRIVSERKFEITEIKNTIHKISLLLSSIVGVHYFSPEHIKRIMNFSLFRYMVNNIAFYYLNVRDELSEIGDISESFCHCLKEEVLSFL